MRITRDDLDDDLLIARIWLNRHIVQREPGDRFQGYIPPQTALGVEPVLLGDGRLEQGLAIDVVLLRQPGDPHHELVVCPNPRRRGCIERERRVGTLVAPKVLAVEPDLSAIAGAPEAKR